KPRGKAKKSTIGALGSMTTGVPTTQPVPDVAFRKIFTSGPPPASAATTISARMQLPKSLDRSKSAAATNTPPRKPMGNAENSTRGAEPSTEKSTEQLGAPDGTRAAGGV